jgi:hypothetical protein
MYSADTSDTLFPNRNMRYNFYDYGTHAWNWLDPDFTVSGIGVFSVPPRTGYGSMDVDTNGAAVISAHHPTTGSNLAPILAHDVDVGQGIFDYAPGEPTLDGYLWPCVGVGMNGYYHLAMIDAVTHESLCWSRLTEQGWDSAMSIPPPCPEPRFPTHNIATSKVSGSNKVCITWVATPTTGFAPMPGFYRESQDGGNNWNAPVDLGFPPAFHPGSETLPSYHVSSLFPLYDRNDNLHIVGNVAPYVRDTSRVQPGQLWHWCSVNPDTWNLVRIASPDSWNGSCGSNAMVCARPSLGQDDRGTLFVAWEEFDGVNVEPTTDRLRADIWCSYSTDNGVTWAEGTKTTDGGEVSHRFPSILNPIGDTVMVEYLVDQVAGFWRSGEGPVTYNPVVVHRVFVTGLAAGKVPAVPSAELSAVPNPFGRATTFSYQLGRAGSVALTVSDVAGRAVRRLAGGPQPAGFHSVFWDGRDDGGRELPAGVYFCTLANGAHRLSRKVVLTE